MVDFLEPIQDLIDDGILSNGEYDLIAESEPEGEEDLADDEEKAIAIAAFLALAALLATAQLTTRQFQTEAARLLRNIHYYKAKQLLKNFRLSMAPGFRKILTDGLKRQFYNGSDDLSGASFGLAWLTRELLNSGISLPRLEYRLGLYAKSDRLLEQELIREYNRKEGRTYAVRQLGITDNHCPSCPLYAEQPPLPIDDVVLPTQACECGNNCLCSLVYLTLEQAVARRAQTFLQTL